MQPLLLDFDPVGLDQSIGVAATIEQLTWKCRRGGKSYLPEPLVVDVPGSVGVTPEGHVASWTYERGRFGFLQLHGHFVDPCDNK